MGENFKFLGPSGSPFYLCLDENFKPSLEFRTLFLQEMIKNGVFMPWVAICYRHTKKELNKTLKALEKSLFIYKKALNFNPKKFIKGPIVKPVFRKYN